MNPLSRMKSFLSLSLPVAAWLASCAGSAAVEIYFGPVTPAEVASVLVVDHPDAQAGSGPNLKKLRVISGPGLKDSASPGGIRLVQAAISPVTASPLGYATHEADALAAAASSLQSAAAYRNIHNQNGLWDIHFDGVPPKANPPERNFFPEKIKDDPGQASIEGAIEYARTAIRANPYRTGPGSGYALLFQAAYESTVPHTWSGNEWRAKAEKDRLGTSVGGAANASIDTRLTSLQTACDRYRTACAALHAFLNHEVESAWLLHPENVNGFAGPTWMPDAITVNGTQRKRWTWPKLLYQAYIEAVTQLAQGEFERLYTRYLKDYGTGDLSALIAEIHACADEIDRLMLPVSAIKAANPLLVVDPENPPDPRDPGVSPLDPEIDTGSPASHSALLRRLADHAVERALFFSPGVTRTPSGVAYSNSSYGPNYIPFLIPAQLASRPFSFDNFLGETYGPLDGTIPSQGNYNAHDNSLIKNSIQADTEAAGLVEDVIKGTIALGELFDETRITYEGQLKQLCGQRRTGSGNTTVPDILGYLLPTEEREPLLANETLGDIALQWSKIEQAETRLFSAYRALAEIDEKAQIIREYGNERLLSYDRIAKIQLSTGEQISALDYLSGEIRAKAIEAEAEERAKQAEKKSWFKSAFKWVAHGVGAIVTGGASLIATVWDIATDIEFLTDVGGALDGMKQAKSQAEMHRNIGRIQADATRRQAEITAQQTRIRAMEGAQITMENATQEDNRIREAIQQLMIGVERQKLEILLAKQQLEFAEIEHANMIGRISTLIEEYRKASIRNAANLLNRPDVRLQRDYEIQEAARKFRVAQEYAFLCARAARYRFTGKTNTLQTQIATAEANILKAQNGTQLQEYVKSLITIRGQFLGSNGTGGLSDSKKLRFSLRDFVAQSNSAAAYNNRDLNGEVIPGQEATLALRLQGYPGSTGGTPNQKIAISDQQFAEFLNSRLKDPEGEGDTSLMISFAIGYEPSFGTRSNPLRLRTVGEYGHVIEGYGGGSLSYIHSDSCGVFVNVRLRAFAPMPINGTLRALGTSYTTTNSTTQSDVPLPADSVRAWNPVHSNGIVPYTPVVVMFSRDTSELLNWRQTLPGLSVSTQGSLLHELSPANDHWELVLQVPSAFRDAIPNITDIEICMTIRGWAN